MHNKVLEAIHTRRSVRKYKETLLTKDQVESIIDAALMAPSGSNEQAWHIGVLQNKETILAWEKEIIQFFVAIEETEIVERNKERGNKIFYDAPCVFVLSMKQGKDLDIGIMAQTVALAVKSMGLESVILGFPRVVFAEKYQGKWEKILQFPTGYKFGIAVAVGHGNAPGRDRTPDHSKVTYLP